MLIRPMLSVATQNQCGLLAALVLVSSQVASQEDACESCLRRLAEERVSCTMRTTHFETPWAKGSGPAHWDFAVDYDMARGRQLVHHLSMDRGKLAGWSSNIGASGEVLVAIAWSGNHGIEHFFSSGVTNCSGSYQSGNVGWWPSALRGMRGSVHLWQDYQMAARSGRLEVTAHESSGHRLRFPTFFGSVDMVLDTGRCSILSCHYFNREGEPIAVIDVKEHALQDGVWVPAAATIRQFGLHEGAPYSLDQHVSLEWDFSGCIRPDDIADMVELQNTVSAFGTDFHRLDVFDQKLDLTALQLRVQGEKLGIPVAPAAPELLQEANERRRNLGPWSSQSEAMAVIRGRLESLRGRAWPELDEHSAEPAVAVRDLLRRFGFIDHEVQYCGQSAVTGLALLEARSASFRQALDLASGESLSVAGMIDLARQFGMHLEAVECTPAAIAAVGAPCVLVARPEGGGETIGHAVVGAFSPSRDRLFVWDGPESVERSTLDDAASRYQLMLVPRSRVGSRAILSWAAWGGLAALACILARLLLRRSKGLHASVVMLLCLGVAGCGGETANASAGAVRFEHPEYEMWAAQLFQAVALPVRVVNSGSMAATVRIDAPSCSCLSVDPGQRTLTVPAHGQAEFTAHITASTDRSVVIPARILGSGEVITTVVNLIVGSGILVDPPYLVCDQRPDDGLLPQRIVVRVIREPDEQGLLRVGADSEGCSLILGEPATKPIHGGRWLLDVYRARVHVGDAPAGGYAFRLARQRPDASEALGEFRVYVR